MNFKEFQQQAERTFPEIKDIYHNKDTNGNLITLDKLYYHRKTESPQILNLLHTRIGIVTETEELMEAIAKKDKVGVGEELADKLWYIGNDLKTCLKAGFIDQSEFNQFVNYKFDGTLQATDCPSMNKTLNDWMNAIVYNEGKLLDQVKKLYAYNKPFDKVVYILRLNYLLAAINNIAVTVKIDIEEYMEKVITKLKLRYPLSFSSENAINRNHTAERVILEQK